MIWTVGVKAMLVRFVRLRNRETETFRGGKATEQTCRPCGHNTNNNNNSPLCVVSSGEEYIVR